MQGGLVWSPAPAVGPGSGYTGSSPQPGSEETPESAVFSGLGWLGATVYVINDVLV
jgi:hypothetical protein